MVGYAEGGHYEWGLVRRTDQAFLGTCGFGEVDLARPGDMGSGAVSRRRLELAGLLGPTTCAISPT